MWPDILGLRPVFRDMGRRLAASGYTVLVPNPFYRTRRAPIVTGPFDFNDPKQVQPLLSLKATFAAAKRPAIVEVYPADHGWCVPGSQPYDQAAAERAWTELLRLYRSTLV